MSSRWIAISHVAYIDHFTFFIEVIDVCINAKHLSVIHTHQEALSAPQFFGSNVSFEFSHPGAKVFTLQMHVHHILFIVHIAPRQFAQFPLFVVYLYLAHNVGWQAVKRSINVAIEKVFSAE